MICTEAYKEHIMYTFNGFCKVVIRYAAINAWRDRSRRRKKEISLEYLTEKSFTLQAQRTNILKHPMKNTPLRYAVRQLSSPTENLPPPCQLCRRKTGKSFSFTFSGITHSGKSGKCTDAAGVRPGIKSIGLYNSCTKKWRCFHMRNPNLLPYETIVRATSGEPETYLHKDRYRRGL